MSYMSLEKHAQTLFKRTTAVKVLNVTSGVELKAGCNELDRLSVSLQDKDLVRPQDIIKTPSGYRYIADSGQCERFGLLTFPAPIVRFFAELYRFDKPTTDAFGRPPADLQLVKDQIPICVHNGDFYTSSAGIKQGDILSIPDTGKYIVQATRFENVNTVRLLVKQQL